MSFADDIDGLRSWAPIPTGDGGISLGRWLLLEGNRYAVTGALLTVTFVSILTIGSVWTFEMHRLLVETQAVQTLLTTFLSGIILLVSIVVSINSIILSYDITHVSDQQDRIEGMMSFWRTLSKISDADESPTDPNTFLQVMADVIRRKARELEESTRGSEETFTREIQEYLDQIVGTAEHIENSLTNVRGGKFGVLWIGLEMDYGPLMSRSRRLKATDEDVLSDSGDDNVEELLQALELFATGREYFKTLYYNQEISELSRTLLVVSLPAIVVTASTILAINAQLLPEMWMFGMPPLLTFVSISFAVALSPFIVLTAYMLRVATVAQRTNGAGPFVLRS
ncbi:hypothetical protein [Haloarcula laminariae]|uniref:hypothetical protein n=1 Tax=Haloarcula laminariae TaxID=2961577 RepID=UPI0021C65C92|nr:MULTISPECIES: hypothetical protein [Halomicroarcula]